MQLYKTNKILKIVLQVKYTALLMLQIPIHQSYEQSLLFC